MFLSFRSSFILSIHVFVCLLPCIILVGNLLASILLTCPDYVYINLPHCCVKWLRPLWLSGSFFTPYSVCRLYITFVYTVVFLLCIFVVFRLWFEMIIIMSTAAVYFALYSIFVILGNKNGISEDQPMQSISFSQFYFFLWKGRSRAPFTDSTQKLITLLLLLLLLPVCTTIGWFSQ